MVGLHEWQSATPIPSLAKREKDAEWERKQRQREYRVAARREKRNRKADEKKQRKLNATILRRMADKYTKNVERNRLRAIHLEQRTIWNEAIKQVQRLAAEHDPSGESFGIGPVIKQEDGSVITVEGLKRREERKAAKEAQSKDKEVAPLPQNTDAGDSLKAQSGVSGASTTKTGTVDAERSVNMEATTNGRRISKTQAKKLAAFAPRPPPPKPKIPDGISIPEGEENWLALWDLDDQELERRVLREKKRKAAARKALRVKQQSGKVERRAARDEKRRVYRDLKMTWKLIKAKEKAYKTRLKSVEQEEGKKIAVAVSEVRRKRALEKCAEFGCTLENTPGVDDVKPKALGMKGQVVDFDALEVGDSLNDIKLKSKGHSKPTGSKRVDLSAVPEADGTRIVPTQSTDGDPEDFIQLDVGEGEDFHALNYNHRLRRKIRRALDATQRRKVELVRDRAKDVCKEKGIEPPPELTKPLKPIHERGQRLLESGLLETAKGERVRLRMELAEYNRIMKVLRKQAKQISLEEGLRAHAEMTGKMPPRGHSGNERSGGYGVGWYVAQKAKATDFLKPDEVSQGK